MALRKLALSLIVGASAFAPFPLLARPIVLPNDPNAAAATASAWQELRDLSRVHGTIRVIVGLEPTVEISARAPDTSEGDEQLRTRIAALQDEVIRDIRPTLRGDNRFEITRFDFIPYIAVNASEQTLERLAARTDIESVAEETLGKEAMIETRPQVQSDWATR